MRYLIELKEYVPLFQTLLWILLIVTLIIIFRKRIIKFYEIFTYRIECGSSFKIPGFEVGKILKENLEYMPQNAKLVSISTHSEEDKREIERTNIYKNNNGIFLTHVIAPSNKPNQKFDIFIYLLRHNINNFDDVEYTEFFFGHMWGNKIYKEYLKNGIIGISTSAYAPFLCTCKVKLKDGDIINLYRYIDFEIYNQLNLIRIIKN